MVGNIKDRLTTEDIIRYLAHFGARVNERTSKDELRFQTVCHNKIDNKYKLYYYIKSKSFYCYNSCGSIGDIFSLTEHILEINSKEAYKYVCNFFKLSASATIDFIYDEDSWGFEGYECDTDIEYVSNKLENITYKPIPKIDENIMNIFLKYKPIEWIVEGINEETLSKYDIRYSLKHNAIVIPHYDINSNLIGVRVRNLDHKVVEEFGKYNPLYLEGEMYNHKLGHNLYGLDKNKDYIKKVKKVVIVESEKAVLQMDSFFGDKSIAVAICGSNLSRVQMKILLDLGVEEFILALDKQYSNADEETIWLKKIEKMITPLLEIGVTVTRIWDNVEGGLLKHKDSPTDLGKEVYMKLVKNRLSCGR